MNPEALLFACLESPHRTTWAAHGWNAAASQELSEILIEGEAGMDLKAGYTSA